MTKVIKMMIIVFLSLVMASCANSKESLDIPSEYVEGVTIYKYDYGSYTTEINWSGSGKDLSALVDYLVTVKVDEISNVEYSEETDVLYGIEINTSSRSYEERYLLVGDTLIKHDGRKFDVDATTLMKLCNRIDKHTQLLDGIEFVINHRHLSLVEEQWDSEFMYRTNFVEISNDIVQVSSEGSYDNEAKLSVEFDISNVSDLTLEYGSRLIFEVNHDGQWYQIEDMINLNTGYGWNLPLYRLKPGEVDTFRFNTEIYDPLPDGLYRLSKDISVDSNYLGHVSYCFTIE